MTSELTSEVADHSPRPRFSRMRSADRAALGKAPIGRSTADPLVAASASRCLLQAAVRPGIGERVRLSLTRPSFQSVIDLGLRDLGVKSEPRRYGAYFGK